MTAKLEDTAWLPKNVTTVLNLDIMNHKINAEAVCHYNQAHHTRNDLPGLKIDFFKFRKLSYDDITIGITGT